MGSKLRLISVAITGLLSYLLASASERRLLFFENVFTEYVHETAFEHSLLILFVLLVLYFIIELIILFRSHNKKLIVQCHNICRYIYKYIEKHIGKDFAHNIRLTIFKANRPNTEDVYLKAVSRYQTKEPFKKTRATFRPGEGVAGCCFQTQTLIYEHLPEYSEKTHEAYYRESWKTFKLSPEKIDKINVKSCLFLSIPIKCFDTEKTWGVLVLDSTKKDEQFKIEFARKIEEIIDHYTVFFTEGDK